TLFLMPSPRAESGPVSGAITPILAVFLAAPPPPPPDSLEQPVATIARITATASPGRIRCFKGLAPFQFGSPVTLRLRRSGLPHRGAASVRRPKPPSDGRPTAASGQVATAALYLMGTVETMCWAPFGQYLPSRTRHHVPRFPPGVPGRGAVP